MVQIGGEAVRVCRFSPDSTLLVTAGDNGQVCLWDLIRRNLIRRLQVRKDNGPTYIPSYDIFLGNEPFTKLYQLVTCGNDHCVKLWEIIAVQPKRDVEPSTAKINLCRIMEKHSSALTCVRFNANGLYVASSGLDETAVIWETSSGKVRTIISGHNRYVACCAFSRDGNLLATGSNDKSAIVWDLTGNLCLDSELARRFTPALLSQDREESAKYERNEYAETSVADNVQLVRRLEEHAGVVNSVAFYGNRLIASGSGDKLVRVWSIEAAAAAAADEEAETTGMKFREKSYSPLDGHKYGINHVEFSPCGTMLASCSSDGTAIVWNTENGSQAKSSFVNSGSGIRVCRWSPDGTKIATAGDDERTTIWGVNNMEELGVFKGHSDAVNAIAFTHDSRYLVTACNEGTWRLFRTTDHQNCTTALTTCEEAHNLGVQGCDFSPTSDITGRKTNVNSDTYFLATSGNDSLVKLWQITISKRVEVTEGGAGRSGDDVRYEEEISFTGHGGNVTCVRFSPTRSEILGSVATDKTARIWSTYSGLCLYVLEEHENLVTTCAFSEDTSLFITGALDKTVLIWNIPRMLISQNVLMNNLKRNRKKVADWKIDDTLKWLEEIGLSTLTEKACAASLTGRRLLAVSEDELIERLRIDRDEETTEALTTQLYWLKREDGNSVEINVDDNEIPDEFLCPITREIMKEPVRCCGKNPEKELRSRNYDDESFN
ncbi:PREDICTED: WD repeat, SAM and U-box domain-containing protein 1-like [Habropoda laboriosa]|uniref:WD repeat, SAM and U-box domain-containing protein 1-like n=1 Tax=Habropoda laboriosa TaxID=597456 RepID=UPI00083E028E|nr:PREDICTED: WD repeat, SAM and U-box domain-containing protein 1-like [Habropoda laboriosa]